tara:strand:+ start:729 stop:989 length:261 start_codon:yes stop_codon:yes gene_type:complete
MSFEDYFSQDVLGSARDIGADSRQFQRSIKFIKQDRYKGGVLFYLNEIQTAAAAATATPSPQGTITTQASVSTETSSTSTTTSGGY